MNEALVVCVRGIISFFTLFIFVRILGKQQLGEITFFDYVLGITIGNFAATLTLDLTSAAWPHWVGLLTWIVLGILMQLISLKSRNMSKNINDEPIIIINDGKVLGQNLKDNRLTLDELLEELRIKDIFDLNEVKFAIIESGGQLSVLKKEQFQNLINSMDIPKDNTKVNDTIIFNGIIIEDNLYKFNLQREWLLTQLKEQGINNEIEVFYAYIDSSQNLILKSYKDNINNLQDIL